MKHGIIRDIQPAGGLVMLKVADLDTGEVNNYYGDNGATIRGFAACYRDVILPGHRFNPDAIIGAEIEFEVCEWNPSVIEGFRPAEVFA